jgi:hypothetical protein
VTTVGEKVLSRAVNQIQHPEPRPVRDLAQAGRYPARPGGYEIAQFYPGFGRHFVFVEPSQPTFSGEQVRHRFASSNRLLWQWLVCQAAQDELATAFNGWAPRRYAEPPTLSQCAAVAKAAKNPGFVPGFVRWGWRRFDLATLAASYVAAAWA